MKRWKKLNNEEVFNAVRDGVLMLILMALLVVIIMGLQWHHDSHPELADPEWYMAREAYDD